uniref:Uncharacterized protein n=1 Tax=Oryzias latipes TaxID=8090 RepID=A0A286P9X3_ORYLA|nr:hypothetical protein [Oryzias latipes]
MSTTPEQDLYSSDVTRTRASSFTVTTDTESFTTARSPEGDGVVPVFSPREMARSEHDGDSGLEETEAEPDSVLYLQLSSNPGIAEPRIDFEPPSDSSGSEIYSSSDDDEEDSSIENYDRYDPALRWHHPDVVDHMRGLGLAIDEEGYWFDPGSFPLFSEPKGVVFEDDD